MPMDLIYIYHSGYALLFEGFTVIIDFYEDSVSETSGCVHEQLLSRPGRLYVLSSHFHADHFNRRVLEWRQVKEDIVYVFSSEIRRRRHIDRDAAVWIRKGETYADDNLSVRAFGSTDAGVSFMIETGGRKIFHAGDLNNWHWMDESGEEEWKGYEKNYLRELECIAGYSPVADLVMFPVDPRLGREYMRGAMQFASRIRTGVFMPMHFGADYAAANAFQHWAVEHGMVSPLIERRGQVFADILQTH